MFCVDPVMKVEKTMQITIERTALLGALHHAQSVVERRNTIPILSNVMLEARDDQLFLTATDMDLTLEEKIDATVMQAGQVTLDTHLFYDIVKKLPEGSEIKLDYSAQDQRCDLSAGDAQFTFPTLPADDFPKIRSDDLGTPIELRADYFRALIERTRFAMSNEETRYYLNGIYFEIFSEEKGTGLRAVATDGHRLAKCDIHLNDVGEAKEGVIFPRKAVNEFYKALDGVTGLIHLTLSSNKVRLQIDDLRMTSKLIDGTFPDYMRVIPKNNSQQLSFDAKEIGQAVDLVSAISSERSKGISMSLESSSMVVGSSASERGKGQKSVSANFSGQPMSIGFNARYLKDVLDQFDGQDCTFLLHDHAEPVRIDMRRKMAGEGAIESHATFVLMPMRV